MGEKSDKRDVRAPGRRVFEDTMQRRKHPRWKVGAPLCFLDIKMNSSDLVSRQMREEDVHPLLGSPQRGSVTHFSNNERRAATRQARRMPARLNIGRVKRTRLRDQEQVGIMLMPLLKEALE